VNRVWIVIGIGAVSFILLGTERTLGCVLGSTLAILVNGVLAGRVLSNGGQPKETSADAENRDIRRELEADTWKTLAPRSAGDAPQEKGYTQ